MADRLLLAGRHITRVARAEAAIQAAAYTALRALTRLAQRQLASSGMDPAVLDSRAPGWQAAVDDTLTPAIREAYAGAFTAGLHPSLTGEPREVTAAAQTVEPGPPPGLSLSNQAADLYLQGDVRNRLVGVSDTVYDQIIAALREGREAVGPGGGIGESIPQLSARIDALLTDEQRWKNRATVIARTETISANNAGYHAAASYSATQMGYTDSQVAKEWLATGDTRTRPTHSSASGQKVIGLDTPFSVGAASLLYPGDPAGPASEVIQCRCVPLYHYPGDPGYPGDTPAITQDAPVEPRTFTSVTEADQWATGLWGDGTSLTGRQFDALRSYTGSSYDGVNRLLRQTKGAGTDKIISDMDAAITAAARIPEPVEVYRGADLRALGIRSSGDPADLIGQEFIEHGYLSTSLNPRGRFMDREVRMTVRVPAGARGIYVSGGEGGARISLMEPSEHELLLARGSRFRVLSVRRVGDRWHVEAELLQD